MSPRPKTSMAKSLQAASTFTEVLGFGVVLHAAHFKHFNAGPPKDICTVSDAREGFGKPAMGFNLYGEDYAQRWACRSVNGFGIRPLLSYRLRVSTTDSQYHCLLLWVEFNYIVLQLRLAGNALRHLVSTQLLGKWVVCFPGGLKCKAKNCCSGLFEEILTLFSLMLLVRPGVFICRQLQIYRSLGDS